MRRLLVALGLAAVLTGALGLSLSACSTSYPHAGTEILGKSFPRVRGASLDGKEYVLPDAFAGAPVLLLIGYEQDTQFDLDRWLLGLQQAGVQVRTHELPTIPGLVPGLFAGRIDAGMRSGIPKEDWPAVITIYRDGADVARFTGNENRLPGRIVLLDAQGRVAFFHDRGYSVATLQRLQDALAKLR
ncbi:MAG: hypothetical protein IT458_00935 [Planctomycetes bacterium]|nr:hypothetical protein [Planctomycetota bacterium]